MYFYFRADSSVARRHSLKKYLRIQTKLNFKRRPVSICQWAGVHGITHWIVITTGQWVQLTCPNGAQSSYTHTWTSVKATHVWGLEQECLIFFQRLVKCEMLNTYHLPALMGWMPGLGYRIHLEGLELSVDHVLEEGGVCWDALCSF